MITGGLHFLPCACPCAIAHGASAGSCSKTPVVATLQVTTDLGTVDLLLCEACAVAGAAYGKIRQSVFTC